MQPQVTENGILTKRDFEAFKNRTVESKFRHQLFLGIGGATVFGLVGAFGKALLDIAMVGGAGAGLAWAGLAAIGFIGLGCIYMGSKFLAESILMDQDFQAKKIAVATGMSQSQAVTSPESTKTNHTTPPGMAAHQHQAHEEEEQRDAHWVEKVPQRERAETHAPRTKADTWADEVRMHDADEKVRIH
jgi:hypothetical protein